MTTDFGRDTWCRDSLRTGRYATGVELVAQAVYHRLITVRGTLRGGEEEANYGLGLEDLVGFVGDVDLLKLTLPGRIRQELLKDERILDAAATVIASSDGPAITLTITIECSTAEGPFRLVLAVGDVTVELVGLEVG